MYRSVGLVILGVAASDAHAVANQLIAMRLRLHGFVVVNLGVCTPLEEFGAALRANPEAVAIVVGSINGHAYEDLQDLPRLRALGYLGCPVILGGNLSVGSIKDDDVPVRFRALGVDYLLDDLDQLVCLLDRLQAELAIPAVQAKA
jgi:methylaspartate mutase sigma subunit